MRRTAPLIALATVALACGCSGGDGGSTDQDSITFPDITDPELDLESDFEEVCDRQMAVFEPGETASEIVEDPTSPFWYVRASISENLSVRPRSFVDIWSSYGSSSLHVGPTVPGTYAISDWEPGRPMPGETCGLCIHLYEDCPNDGTGMCTHVFAATGGTIDITALAIEPAGRFTATLAGVYLEEWDGFQVVIGGESYCIDLWEVDVTFPAG